MLVVQLVSSSANSNVVDVKNGRNHPLCILLYCSLKKQDCC